MTDNIRKKCEFLRDYAKELYSGGATTVRIEKNLSTISKAWGMESNFTILPTCIILNATGDGEECSISTKNPPEHLNLAKVKKLSCLSVNISERNLSLNEADQAFREIVNEKPLNEWIVLLLTGFANAAFCELFGGDVISVVIVFISTILGFCLKQRLPKLGLDLRVTIILSACLSALISCTGYVFGLGNTPEIALATSVLYFVPGIPFSNAVCDLLYGYYICSISRLLHALVITVCLSLGYCLAFFILNMKFI